MTIHALLREDIFAGLLENDLQRLTRGEKNIQLLLQQRPEAKRRCWDGRQVPHSTAPLALMKAAELTSTVSIISDRSLFEKANRLDGESIGVVAVTFVLLADRLPKKDRADAWSRAYKAFQTLWKQQGLAVDKLPLHIRGELLAGLGQSAQRTGRSQEAAQFLEKIQTLLPDTPYANIAQQWKESPESVTSTSIACRTCHESGRLASRLAALK